MSQFRQAKVLEIGAALAFDDLFSSEAIDDLQFAAESDKLSGYNGLAIKGSGSEASESDREQTQDFALAA